MGIGWKPQFHTLLMISASAAACLFGSTAFGQRISLGVVVGGYGNADFVSHYIPTPGHNPDIAVSDRGGYVVGPTFEARLVRRLSFAIDALYKPLHHRQSAAFYPDGTVGYAPATVVTRQIPLPAKYRFPFGALRPFLEGRPSFRAAGNLNTTNPSHHGISAGAGIEGRWRALSMAPGVRCTRWAKDRYPWTRTCRPVRTM
jgi:hypothetical protein